jgi:hypothetical protein
LWAEVTRACALQGTCLEFACFSVGVPGFSAEAPRFLAQFPDFCWETGC